MGVLQQTTFVGPAGSITWTKSQVLITYFASRFSRSIASRITSFPYRASSFTSNCMSGRRRARRHATYRADEDDSGGVWSSRSRPRDPRERAEWATR